MHNLQHKQEWMSSYRGESKTDIIILGTSEKLHIHLGHFDKWRDERNSEIRKIEKATA